MTWGPMTLQLAGIAWLKIFAFVLTVFLQVEDRHTL